MSDSVREFLSDWWRSRDWALFRWGLFSMVGGIGLVVMLLFAELQSSWDRSGQYLGVARHARAKGDLEAATILYEKALKERQDDAVALFEWMVVSDELGEHSSRDATLGYLVDEVGHLPALLYAGRLALREGKVDEANEILESSLDKIPEKERGPGSVLAAEADDIRRGLMRVRWRGGAFREAIEQGNRLIDPVFRDEMDLAVLHLRAGDLEVAQQKAAGLRDRLGEFSRGRETDLFSALAESVRGREVEAMRFLDQAARWGGSRPAILAARVRCFELLRISKGSVPDLRLLEAPAEGGSPAVIGPLVELISDGSLTDKLLVKAVVAGKVPLVGHLVLGLRALRAGREADARLHFGLANDLSAAGGGLLGWCGVRLARIATRDGEALFLADLATSLNVKSEGALRKGRILLALERWDALDLLLEGETLSEDETLSTEAKVAFRTEIAELRASVKKYRNEEE